MGLRSPPHSVDTCPVDSASRLMDELSESAINTSGLEPKQLKHLVKYKYNFKIFIALSVVIEDAMPQKSDGK